MCFDALPASEYARRYLAAVAWLRKRGSCELPSVEFVREIVDCTVVNTCSTSSEVMTEAEVVGEMEVEI